MADSEAQSYARLRRLVAEPNPIIQGYDEAAWANEPKLAYADGPVENSIAVFAAVRAASLDLIKRLEENVGYADQSSLPPWMTSNQPDPSPLRTASRQHVRNA